MKSLLLILVFSTILLSVNTIIDLINADQSAISCLADCLCIHGLANATCTSEGNCICNNDEGLTETQLAQRRVKECSNLTDVILNDAFIQLLCPDGNLDGGTCNADCKCGHKAPNGGSCRNDGYHTNGVHLKLCKCLY